jgi:site-specific DNA-methyltransferase (adenine-specific)
MTYQILKGNSLDLLPTLADNSIDAIVTDPPYGLGNPDPDYIIKAIQLWASGDRSHIPEGKGFMGKSWDSFVPPPAIWDECLRVLKPGGHLLAFAGTRTYDLMGISIRMAGFEIRDSIGWVYGSGFPKSMDVAKAIDKQSGYQGEVVGTEVVDIGMQGGSMHAGRGTKLAEREIKDLSPEAQQWQGWGTALKPALEPIVVARKPLIGTVAENVLTHGTGGLNIDASRIGYASESDGGDWDRFKGHQSGKTIRKNLQEGDQELFEERVDNGKQTGRWPANLILDEYTAELLDEQSGTTKSTPTKTGGYFGESNAMLGTRMQAVGSIHEDKGGASRFFYVAKASKRDRNEGLEELLETSAADMVERDPDSAGMNSPRAGAGRTSGAKNFHPTVKPTALMQYLVKLITPPGGTVLDPFTGSGSTGKAAILEGFDFIGIELTEDYWPIIEGRLKHAEAKVAGAKENIEAEPQGLF